MKTLEMRDINPKEVARRLVSICGGSKQEAMSTLIEGARNLPAYGNLLYNVSREVMCVREASQEAYTCIYRGRTRKGGTPSVRRYL